MGEGSKGHGHSWQHIDRGTDSLSPTFKSDSLLGACRAYGDRSENSAGRGQILRVGHKVAHPRLPHLPVLQVNSRSIDQKNGEIWIAQADSQPIHHKSDRLLATRNIATALGNKMNSFPSLSNDPFIVFFSQGFLRPIPESVFVVIVPNPHQFKSHFRSIFSHRMDFHLLAVR